MRMRSGSRIERHKSEENYGRKVHKSPFIADSGPPSRDRLPILGDGGGTGGDNIYSRNAYESNPYFIPE